MKRFAQTTLWYTAVGLIGPMVALVLTPLYTRAIGVAGYGTVDILLSLWQGAGPVRPPSVRSTCCVLAALPRPTTEFRGAPRG